MIFYDFEVFKHDWLVVLLNTTTRQETVIHNNVDSFSQYYRDNRSDIWVGYNSNGYDKWVVKAILAGFTPQEMNDWIINQKEYGWQFSQELHRHRLYNYDVMKGKAESLKQLEAFMGHDIRETTVPFDLDRPLTNEELDEVIFYCRHDVHETAEVFSHRINAFQAQLDLIKLYDLPLKHISKTQAQLSAVILQAYKKDDLNDEYNLSFPDNLQIDKYWQVKQWFENFSEYHTDIDEEISGVPHVFAAGGVHGAINKYHHECGPDELMIMADVDQLYPTLMVKYDLLSRNVTHPEKFQNILDTSLRLKAEGRKKEREPYKLICNITYGAEGDKYNPMYDPRNRLMVCAYGQLFILDLIEKLEVIPSYQLIQSNTDGILVKIKRKDFDLFDDIVYEWEERTQLHMSFDYVKKIHQKDVNNYIIVKTDDSVKAIGAYVKDLNPLDYDLPIVNKAVKDYFIKGIPVERTIGSCDQMIEFQKVVKVSSKYEGVVYGGDRQHLKVFRVFAAIDGHELKKLKDGKPNKIAYVPEICRVVNENIVDKTVPDWVDKSWYIELAKKRVTDFLG